MSVELFDQYSKLFREHGFRLYLVGGSTRDYLLELPLVDFDFATDATPDEMMRFLPDANDVFARFGAIKLGHCVFTTFREEKDYADYRHPSFINYVKTPREDYVRRDFTINAIYLDENYNIVDYCGGVVDLKNRILKFIGNPSKRVTEDPLRILRGERFAKKYGLSVENNTMQAMKKYRYLLKNLNQQKIDEELRKQKK